MTDQEQSVNQPNIEEPNSLIGQTLANYHVQRVIGKGGMAVVYYGTDIKLNRPVAIKVIDSRFKGNKGYAERFVRESQIVATWRHPNILQIYYADDIDGTYFFAMEFIDGLDLRQLVSMYNRDGQLMPVEDVLRIGYAIADALDYAHNQDVVHRDVKPSNVMVAYSGRVLLTDFGLAMQMTDGSMGEVFGTPLYMAPEQAKRSADAVPESDNYSLSVMLFEMLTGRVPFDDESPTSVALMHLTEEPPLPSVYNPDLSVRVDSVLMKGMQKEPDKRYHTAKAMMDDLYEAIVGERPQSNQLKDLNLIIEGRENQDELIPKSISQLTVADRLKLENQSGVLSDSLMRADTVTPDPVELSDQVTGGSFAKKAAKIDEGVAKVSSADESSENAITHNPSMLIRPEFDSTPAKPSRSQSWLALLLLGIGVVLVGFAVFFSPAVQDRLNPEPIAVIPVATEAAEAPTPTVEPESQLTLPAAPPAVTSIPTVEPTPESAASQELEAVVEEEPTPEPPTATPTSPPILITSIPVEDPDLLLIYNNPLAFYIHNPTNESVDIERLTFVGIREDGRFTRFAYTGDEFGRTEIEPGRCNALELVEERPEIRPDECEGFNWLNFPGADTVTTFWNSRPDLTMTHFQVLSSGRVIQTCPIIAATCEVELP